MSLRAERLSEGSRRFRIARELRVITGQTVPWHEQPGGGTAYLLPRSVDEHLADGSLIALS
ncbi:TNT domain-containing protein [Allokutzneria sp. NRRL B-24872]|uniref:TNT domain-containing protein n=1 Tax=Allokutzneria sp. NRRL B-24872 TaxID=1137961 RepID=UPI000A3A006B|nr:TNT domain-containing protein [Allokutzneria sp. NRRL B-24872]